LNKYRDHSDKHHGVIDVLLGLTPRKTTIVQV